jgi:hypothetical protein
MSRGVVTNRFSRGFSTILFPANGKRFLYPALGKKFGVKTGLAGKMRKFCLTTARGRGNPKV